MCELTVILKDSERTYRQKFLIYDEFSVNSDDQTIKECIEEAMKSFEGDPDNIIVKIEIIIQ